MSAAAAAAFSWTRIRAMKADVEFRDALRGVSEDANCMASLSDARRDYVRLALAAMNWWIETGRGGQPAPDVQILRKDAAPRNKIVIAYILENNPAEMATATGAIAAQERHMAGMAEGGGL